METRQSWKEVAEVQGIWRVLLAKKGIVQAGLAVSRAFGDLELKKPKELVTAVPEVKTYEVRGTELAGSGFAAPGVCKNAISQRKKNSYA